MPPPARYSKYFEKVVLAERLREVRALVGFTRIESPSDYDNPAAFPAEYAFTINMELGLLITGGKLPGQVEEHFQRLIETGHLALVKH